MPKITIDGQSVEAREGIPVLQAALEAGADVPHYCYHPGLSIVASCRLCLMETKAPDPKTKELAWSSKLIPSCQTLVKEGMEVRFDSDNVRQNQKHVMEYYLLNHPLDCPVCDKAGECYLQDYSEKFGHAASRMIEDKLKNPKKDIGSHTLLYQDRCVLCTRCVRFCQEIAGDGELSVVDRGNRSEIDVFPGVPLENELQGNVVDLCPVGALLDKEFLFKQRVWLMRKTKSISPADSRGQAIWIDSNEEGIHRVRPRFNPGVNDWWISDEARFGWKQIYRPDRVRQPMLRRAGAGSEPTPVRWEELPTEVNAQVTQAAADGDGKRFALVLSPMMSCEEAWLLSQHVRGIAPQATLVLGFVPTVGQDKTFKKGFVIKAEKCPNRRGVERIIQHFGGATKSWADFLRGAGEGAYAGAYLTGGYAADWVTPAIAQGLGRIETLIVHDMFPSALTQRAAAVIPGASWAEREGTFMNCDGLVQEFDRAVPPVEGVKSDGQFFVELSGQSGLFRARKVREPLATAIPELGKLHVPPPEPKFAH